MAAKYKERFSTGLLTASGSVGLLFPPSLPVILYGVYGHVAIDRLFLASLLPGVLLVIMLATFSLYQSRSRNIVTSHFNLREAVIATWAAKGDLLLPVMILYGLFGGILTLVETAALTAFWKRYCTANLICATVYPKLWSNHPSSWVRYWQCWLWRLDSSPT